MALDLQKGKSHKHDNSFVIYMFWFIYLSINTAEGEEYKTETDALVDVKEKVHKRQKVIVKLLSHDQR